MALKHFLVERMSPTQSKD